MTLQAIDIAIGITFVYLILSLVCSTLLELLSQWRGKRGEILERGIKNLVGGGNEGAGAPMAAEVYAHPLVGALAGNDRKPSYIPADLFSEAFLDKVLAPDGMVAPALASTIRSRLATSSTPAAEVALKYFDECGGDLGEVKKRLAGWYSASMDRVSGWYKRWTAGWLLGIAAVVAVGSNADTLRMIHVLSADEATRSAVVAAALERAEQTVPDAADDVRAAAKEGLLEIGPLIGWNNAEWENRPGSVASFVMLKVFGLLITTISLSLGAPFWFDVLQKLSRVRSSVKPSSTDESPDKPEAGTRSNQPVAPKPSGSPTILADGRADAEDAYIRGMVGFRPHTAGVRSDVNAHWLARLCAIAYIEPHARARAECEALGLIATENPLRIVDAAKRVDVQCLVAGDSSVCIVAFRGTEPTKPADIITDLTFNLIDVKWCPGKAHKGFLAYLDAIWGDLLKAIDARRSEGQSLWFTGHSLGGALAVLAAARYVAERPAAVVHGVYTFGQPRIGDAALGAWTESRLGPFVHRYVNNRDIVTRVPTRLNGYHEGGTVIYFDERGVLRTNPGFWFRFLDTVAITPDEVREKGKEGIADHSIALYVELLAATTKRAAS